MSFVSHKARLRLTRRTAIPRQPFLLGDAHWGMFDTEDISQILSDERWYGDKPPHWEHAVKQAKAKEWWRKGHLRLARKPGRNAPFDTLAAHSVISSCKPRQRCKSNGCYLCCRAFQRWLITALRWLQISPCREEYQDRSFTYIYPEGQCAIGTLRKANFKKHLQRTLQVIENTGLVEFGILAFDNSFNDDRAKFAHGEFHIPPELYWQIHLYGIIRTRDFDLVMDALRAATPENEKIRQIVRARKSFDGKPKVLSYIFKPTAYKRQPFKVQKGSRKGDWAMGDAKALNAAQHVEYLVAAHELGIPNRICLINLHPERTPPSPKRGRRYFFRKLLPRSTTM